jgi:SPP1 family phage portal protein
VQSREMFGRATIYTGYDEVTENNILDILKTSLPVFQHNSADIDYLWKYMKGRQPILSRVKEIRPEINNKVVENHAFEIVNFLSGYLMGEPCTYVSRAKEEDAIKKIDVLNSYMYEQNKASVDKDLSMWFYVCGIGYKMILPSQSLKLKDGLSPFEIDVLDPRYTFVVYQHGFGSKRMMGVRKISRMDAKGNVEFLYCGYTKTHYFECTENKLEKWEAHTLGDIPIYEYKANMAMLGSFEPALWILDAINNIASNRLDGIEQFIQAFIKFVNCDIDSEDFKELKDLGAIKIKSTDGQKADVEIVSQELSQTETQTLVDYLYNQVLTICGLPTTNRSQGGSSDNGVAVILRQGWEQCEARARDTELLFKKSEKEFLKLALKLLNTKENLGLKVSDVDVKFTRRQHDNLLTKTQGLMQMLEAGLKPEIAIATCGLFNDPVDVSIQSKEYLDLKWGKNAVQQQGVDKNMYQNQQEKVDKKVEGEGNNE